MLVLVALGAAGNVSAQSGAAGAIVYRCGNDLENLCRIALDGAQPVQLTSDGQPGGPLYTSPSLSADGTRLAFTYGNLAYVGDSNASNRVQRSNTQVLQVALRPDGGRIATVESLLEQGALPCPQVSTPGGLCRTGFYVYGVLTFTRGERLLVEHGMQPTWSVLPGSAQPAPPVVAPPVVAPPVVAPPVVAPLSGDAQANFADERTDWGVPPQEELQSRVGTRTPTTVPGATTVYTPDVVAMASDDIPRLLIDALADDHARSIPGAIRTCRSNKAAGAEPKRRASGR